MEEDEERILYARAINKWGWSAQLLMVFEEMAELTDALTKFERLRVDEKDVIEEIIDVEIMLGQMKYAFVENSNLGEYYQRRREEKLNRLKRRLNKGEKE